MTILISDSIAEETLSYLKSQEIEFDYLPKIEPEKLLEIIPDYQGLIVRSRTKVTNAIIQAGKNLKVIGRVGSGLDNIDLKTAKLKNIKIINSPDANAQSVAEHTVGLMLASLRNYKKAFMSMSQGLWLKAELSGTELNGQTVGIIGYGRIGQKVEKILSAFGAKMQIYSKENVLADWVKNLDILTIHLPLTSETKGLISEKVLRNMKPSVLIINTARGEIIDEQALVQLIKVKKIGGAALDVFVNEPLNRESELRKLDQVILTPHLGASTKEGLLRGSMTVVENIAKILLQ